MRSPLTALRWELIGLSIVIITRYFGYSTRFLRPLGAGVLLSLSITMYISKRVYVHCSPCQETDQHPCSLAAARGLLNRRRGGGALLLGASGSNPKLLRVVLLLCVCCYRAAPVSPPAQLIPNCFISLPRGFPGTSQRLARQDDSQIHQRSGSIGWAISSTQPFVIDSAWLHTQLNSVQPFIGIHLSFVSLPCEGRGFYCLSAHRPYPALPTAYHPLSLKV